MSNPRQNGSLKASSLGDVAVTTSMIVGLRRSITVLNCDIAAEEKRAEMSMPQPALPRARPHATGAP